MKNRLSNLVKKVIAPMALVTAMTAFSSVTVMAQNRGGHEGGRGGISGGHSNAAPNRGNFGGHTFSDRGNGQRGGDFNRGNSERRFESRGEFRGDRDFHGDRAYSRPGFRVGVGIYPSYGYVAPVCNPAGFYDRWGNWQYYPGCVPPYGY
jgi:hypothetical protein